MTFLRTRQCRRSASSCFFSEFISGHSAKRRCLLNGLTFLANDMFADVTHAFALVRFGRIVTSQFRRYATDDLAVRAVNGESCAILFDGHLNPRGYRVIDVVAEAELHDHHAVLDLGFETHALNLELLLEPLT